MVDFHGVAFELFFEPDFAQVFGEVAWKFEICLADWPYVEKGGRWKRAEGGTLKAESLTSYVSRMPALVMSNSANEAIPGLNLSLANWLIGRLANLCRIG